MVQETVARASCDEVDLDFEHRLLCRDGTVQHLHALAHAVRNEAGTLEFIAAVPDKDGGNRHDEHQRCGIQLPRSDGFGIASRSPFIGFINPQSTAPAHRIAYRCNSFSIRRSGMSQMSATA
jgi:hypothetical protein